MKKAYRILIGVLEIVVILHVIIVTAILLSKNKYGYTQFGDCVISTVSHVDAKEMKSVKKGDLLIVHHKKNIKKGDTIYYYVVNEEAYLIRSDIVSNVETDNYNSIYTIGKNGMDVASSRVLGKDKITFHHLGSVLDVVESRPGFLFLVLLPIILVFIYQVYELIKVFKEERSKEEKEEEEEAPKEAKKKKKR